MIIAKIDNQGNLRIKGEVIESDNITRIHFDKNGNLYVKEIIENKSFYIDKTTLYCNEIIELDNI